MSEYMDICMSEYLDILIFEYLNKWIYGYLDIWISELLSRHSGIQTFRLFNFCLVYQECFI